MMCRNAMRFVLAAFAFAAAAGAQTVVDRIAVRVEDDVILESEVRELGLYQQLVNGRIESRDKRLTELIEQWIARTEATAALFPRPTDEEADRALADLQQQFPSREAFQARLRELRLTQSAVRELLIQQLYVSRYLEYKFRPAAQVDSATVEKYYREELVPAFQARGQSAPALDAVRDQIHELLVQQEISKRAAQWLEESRSRLKTEIFPADEKSSGKTASK